MPKMKLKKEKWTLSFDVNLKNLLIKEAGKIGVYPVGLLEQIVRERLNPFGYLDVKDSAAYIKKVRKSSRVQSDEEFLNEIKEWQKLNS